MGCDQFREQSLIHYIDTRDVVKKMQAEDFDSAKKKTLNVLRSYPERGEHHLNLGLIQEITKEPEQALKSYRRAEKESQNPLLKSAAFFNMAQLLAKDKKVDEALSFYQQALSLQKNFLNDQDSLKIKANIELLMQQQQGQGKGEGSQEPQNEDEKKDKDKDKEEDQEKNQEKKYAESPKYKPREFQGKELTEYDVKQILGEIERQEQKMRSDYHRKKTKEKARDKDW